jgi:hypothetical protein
MKLRLFTLALLIIIAALPVAAQSSGGISSGKEPHPVIKNKPEPEWPKSIKKTSEVLIVLRAVFTSDAKVTNIRFVETRPKEHLDYSEDEIKDLIDRAKDAAGRIKFIPATKDGKNVSMWMQLEYAFQLDKKGTSATQEPKKP